MCNCHTCCSPRGVPLKVLDVPVGSPLSVGFSPLWMVLHSLEGSPRFGRFSTLWWVLPSLGGSPLSGGFSTLWWVLRLPAGSPLFWGVLPSSGGSPLSGGFSTPWWVLHTLVGSPLINMCVYVYEGWGLWRSGFQGLLNEEIVLTIYSSGQSPDPDYLRY